MIGFNMLKAFERVMYYELDGQENPDSEVKHYGVFNVKFHDGVISSIDNEDPIGWWYKSIDDLVKENPDVIVDSVLPNYQNTLIEIYNRWQKPLTTN